MRNLRMLGRLLLLTLAVVPTACDFPTETPRWDSLWVVPGDTVTLEVSDFFPSGVTSVPREDAFEISMPAVTFTRSLGELCGAVCEAVNGATIPKPGFSTSFSSTIGLPADLVSATIVGGRIDLRLSHNFSFDPIRPSASARGFIVITVARGDVTLARDTISGASTAFARNTTLARTLSLAPATVTGPISVNVAVSSPAGDPVRVDTNQRLTVQATPSRIRASEARVRVGSSRTISGEEVELDLGDIDSEMIESVQGGALRLVVDNPFAATGALNLSFRTASRTINKRVQVGTGSTRARVEFTPEEIRALVEESPIALSASGTFNVPGGVLTVRPSQQLRVRTDLELTIGAAS